MRKLKGLLLVAAVAMVAFIAIPNLLPGIHIPGLYHKEVVKNSGPVILGEIKSHFTIVTASQVGTATVHGVSKGIWGTHHSYDYQSVVNCNAGVDLSSLNEGDIKVDEATKAVSIYLPNPQIVSAEVDQEKSGLLGSHSDWLDFGDHPDLLQKLQGEAKDKAVADITSAGRLFDEAKKNAEADLRNLLKGLGFTNVQFHWGVAAPTDATTPSRPLTR